MLYKKAMLEGKVALVEATEEERKLYAKAVIKSKRANKSETVDNTVVEDVDKSETVDNTIVEDVDNFETVNNAVIEDADTIPQVISDDVDTTSPVVRLATDREAAIYDATNSDSDNALPVILDI